VVPVPQVLDGMWSQSLGALRELGEMYPFNAISQNVCIDLNVPCKADLIPPRLIHNPRHTPKEDSERMLTQLTTD
jgi:hypothetical protein